MDDPYAALREHFAAVEGATVNTGRGAQGIKWGGKMFAMFYKGDLLLQLAPERVAEMTGSGEGLAFDPGTGRPMADRVLIPASHKDDWISLAEESRRYAASRSR